MTRCPARKGFLRPWLSSAAIALALISVGFVHGAGITGLGAPMITASTSSLEFGVLGVDDGPTARQVLTITNDGNANLTISSISVAGLDPGDFAKAADSSETTLAPTQSRLVSMEYDPTTRGAAHGAPRDRLR